MTAGALHPLQGHEKARTALAYALLSDAPPSTLLIHGQPGVGKQRLALWLGQLMLCEQPGVRGPCNLCRPCRLALRLEHPDLHWYFPLSRPKRVSGPERLEQAFEEARSDILEEIRSSPLRATASDEPRGFYLALARSLRRQAQKRPAMAARQIFIIADAELLVPQESSPEAANALLKVLEEPNPKTTFILTSSSPGRVLGTIRSRSLPFFLPGLPADEVTQFLVDVAGADPTEAGRASTLASGSIGKALGFLPDGSEPGPLEQLRREALDLVRVAVGEGPRGIFETALGYAPRGARGLQDLLGFVEGWLRDVAAMTAGVEHDSLLNPDSRVALGETVATLNVHPQVVAKAIEAVGSARELAAGNVNPQLIMTGLLAELRDALAAGTSADGRTSPGVPR